MDFNNLKQFIPGYHSIADFETIRISNGEKSVRYCQAIDKPLSNSTDKTFILADTKRQFDRWRFPLCEGAIIEDFNGTYQVLQVDYASTSDKNSGIPICRTRLIDEAGLTESDYIFGVLHQIDLKNIGEEIDTLAVSGKMKSSGNLTVKEFNILSLRLPQGSSFDKAFIVLTPNAELIRKNFLIDSYSKIDEHGNHYKVCEIDYAIRPTYPFLLTKETA